MKIKCTDIEWATEDEEIFDTLPQEVGVDLDQVEDFDDEDITEDNSSIIADHLAEEYGFCVYSFNYQIA